MMPLRRSRRNSPSKQSHIDSVESFTALGTHWHITLPGLSANERISAISLVKCKLEEYEQTYSRFRVDSLVSTMARRAGTYCFPDTIVPIWQLYQQLASITNNRFTPFIGSLVSAAGYDQEYSLQTKSLKPPPSWDTIQVSLPTITAHHPVQLDFGAAGKGYAIDLMLTELKTLSIKTATINAGGDSIHMAKNTSEEVRVGLEHPLNDQQAIGVVTLQNQSLCGSAGNRRAWGNFHHIIDPATLASPKHILATWVIADSAMLADALATCLFFVEPKQLLRHYEFSYVIVFADQSVTYSSTNQITLF